MQLACYPKRQVHENDLGFFQATICRLMCPILPLDKTLDQGHAVDRAWQPPVFQATVARRPSGLRTKSPLGCYYESQASAKEAAADSLGGFHGN